MIDALYVIALALGLLGTLAPVIIAVAWRRRIDEDSVSVAAEVARAELLASIAEQLGASVEAGESDHDVYRKILRALAGEFSTRATLSHQYQCADDALRAILSLALGVQVPRGAAVAPEAVVRQVVLSWCRPHTQSIAAYSN